MSDPMPPPPPGSETPEPAPQASPQRRGKGPVLIAAGLVILIAAAVIIVVTRPKSSTSATASRPAPTSPVAGGQLYAANGVNLSFPEAWVHGPSILVNQTKPSVWSETFSPKLGIPEGVVVTEYLLNGDSSHVSPEALETELKNLATSLAQGSGGEVTSDVTPTTVGTLTAYEVSFTATLKGVQYTLDLTVVFHGADQYNINCQSSAAEAATIAPGCQMVKDTFQITP
jgi:hypothetical protein